MESNKLFTYDRLKNFVSGYSEYVDRKKEEEKFNESKNYKYYHFEESPDGVSMYNLGRFGRALFQNIPGWSSISKNSIEAWKMNLANLLGRYKKKEMEIMKEKSTESNTKGLPYIINCYKSNDGGFNIDKLLYVATQKNDDLCLDGETTDWNGGVYVNPPPGMQSSEDYICTVNWYGLLYCEPGNYKLECIGNNCDSYIWLGNDAVAEYTSDNSSINKNSQVKNFFVSSEKYIPIRIQCIIELSNATNYSLNINLSKTTISNDQEGSEGSEGIVTALSIGDFLYHFDIQPLVLYCAFVSENQKDFEDNKFRCYTMFEVSKINGVDEININTEEQQLVPFYNAIRDNLKDIQRGMYDYNNSGRRTWGQLPDSGLQYTQFEGTDPAFCYSIYRIDSDIRMGKTFQIEDKLDTNAAYKFLQFNDKLSESIIEYANSYREKPGFYPNTNMLKDDTYSGISDSDRLQCKNECNESGNCRYYFSYTSNEKPKCIIGTNSELPYYNRNHPVNTQHPVDKNSSSLFLRNYQIASSPQTDCEFGTISGTGQIPVETTSDYSDSFKFSNYIIGNSEISDAQKIGLCGDEEYIKKKNDAYDILYNNFTYYKDGTFTPAESTVQESFIPDSKKTSGINDTGDAIRANLKNEKIYAGKMEKINKNYETIKHKVPEYEKLRQTMIDEPKYDHAGNELLYFRNKLLPDVRKKRVMDNNELYVNSQLLFTLGTVTAATLIIFGIVLARD